MEKKRLNSSFNDHPQIEVTLMENGRMATIIFPLYLQIPEKTTLIDYTLPNYSSVNHIHEDCISFSTIFVKELFPDSSINFYGINE